MENFPYSSSYADSRDSSPRSSENPSWDELPSNLNANNYKVKFMCSYGGKIQPRSHDNQLTYTSGDTKILAVDRNISFSALSSRLSSLCDVTVCFKYQLPGEDLDALISVTNDEDLEHMMLEYDRLYRVSKPARLRLFLFPLNLPASTNLGSRDSKSDRQWFVDALNSVRIQPLEDSSLPAANAPGSASNPDFLFGFDKGYTPAPAPAPVPGSNLTATTAVHTVSNTAVKNVSTGSDCGSEDRHVVGEPVVSHSEFHRQQIQDVQRLQSQTEKSNDEINNSHPPKVTEKIAPPPTAAPLPVPSAVSSAYFSERQMISAGFPVTNAPTTDQSIYLIPTAGGLFQAQTLRPMNGPVGHHPYYGMHTYREPQVHNSMAQHASIQQPNIGVYTTEGIQMMQPKLAVNEAGYAQIAYDNTGRQVYFTTSQPYQTMAPAAVDGIHSGGGAASYNPDGNNMINPSKASGL